MKQPPTLEQLKRELAHERYKVRFVRTLWSTVFTLVVVAAFTVLVAVLWLPILEIYGGSMTPNIEEGEIVVAVRTTNLERGDIVAFYYGNKLLVKRVIGIAGDTIDLEEDGTVLVNGEVLEEPYVQTKSYGSSDVEYPIEIAQEKFFVMGDNRITSMDSRHEIVGCIQADQVEGKVILRIWPFSRFGKIGVEQSE